MPAHNVIPNDIEGQFVRLMKEGDWIDGTAVLNALASKIGSESDLDEPSAVSAARLTVDRALAYGFMERREDGRLRLLPLPQRNEVRASFMWKKPAPTMVTLDDKTTGETFTVELGSRRESELRQQIAENADAAFYAGFERAKRAHQKKSGNRR